MSQTIETIYDKFVPLIGIKYVLPITKNKGLPGSFLEKLLDIPHTSNCLDCSDGELKTFPVKKLKNGKLVPDQTMSITMISTDELVKCDFNSSKCCKKMNRMLVVPYYRTGEIVQFMNPKIINKSDLEEVYKIIESDYNEIRKIYIETGKFHSETGKLLQNRTKGCGHGSTSRGFYLRKEFMKECVPLNL